MARASDILFQGCGLAGMIVLTLGVALGTARPHSDRLAAVFPPWWSPAHIFAAAAEAGRIVALGRVPATLIVHGDPARLADRLRSAGALILIDSSFLAGCQTPAEIAR